MVKRKYCKHPTKHANSTRVPKGVVHVSLHLSMFLISRYDAADDLIRWLCPRGHAFEGKEMMTRSSMEFSDNENPSEDEAMTENSSVHDINSYVFENETTLDHDDDLYDVDLEVTASEVAALEQRNELTDIDYLPIDEDNLEKSFSLDYMKRAVEYFYEKDPLTRQLKRNWCTKYIENGGTKKQKIDDVDIFAYDQFENARHQLLPVHDIDLRRWSLKKACELNLRDFEASHTWLLNFKY
ncbi:unnamed protein product [Rotaria magnacalcarata]|uniref:HTH CENPB-type domain-containing protein n=1 Tax=Rotaria magnacalcarata TaxID=392030 RepID=A0A816W418_9BILA|nr:unnamed protein product [Rotaria magnacalcarata]